MEDIRTEELTETAVETEEQPAERDYGSEVRALYEARPELRGEELPEEVVRACVQGEKLTDAYSRYAKNRGREDNQLRQENRILRDNARSAAQAPVRGISRGGGVSNKPEDPFLRGFNADW